MNKQKPIFFYRKLLTFLNTKEALFLSRMIDIYNNSDDEWFMVTAFEIYHDTGLSKAQQLTIKKCLYKLEILKTERRGIPPKNWYTINTGKLKTYFPEAFNE